MFYDISEISVSGYNKEKKGELLKFLEEHIGTCLPDEDDEDDEDCPVLVCNTEYGEIENHNLEAIVSSIWTINEGACDIDIEATPLVECYSYSLTGDDYDKWKETGEVIISF